MDWITEYQQSESPHRRYELLRSELTRLRGAAHEQDDCELFDREAVAASLRDHNERLDGELIAFVANDFGLPVAFRPETVPRSAQETIHRELSAVSAVRARRARSLTTARSRRRRPDP